MSDQLNVNPFTFERVCKPHPDIEQLVLKEVDTTESVFTRTLVQLKDASLPDAVLYDSIEQMTLGVVSWDLFVMLSYRQDWKPSGYGLGELLYAVSLMPNEELTLELKTWETSKTQQDTEDSTDQRNVSDVKSLASSANEVTTGEETKTHEYVDAKAGYSGFGFSASLAAGWSQDVSTMQKNFAKSSQERSQQATNEYRASHKVKMSVSREAGSESKTTRKIKNINQAHTLNVNYFEVLREYEVKLTLTDVSLVLLGAEPNLAQSTGYSTWDDPPQPITVGRLIRWIGSPLWVQAFVDRYGVSPIKVLRQMWAAPLFDAAIPQVDWTEANIAPEEKEAFRDTILQWVRPTPGWVEPDQTGALRWGYQVLPGQERALLEYLYGCLPFSVQQVIGRALLADVNYLSAWQGTLARYAEATLPGFRDVRRRSDERMVQRAAAVPLRTAKTNNILTPGHFHGTAVGELPHSIAPWVKGIVDQFNRLKGSVGVVTIDGRDSWKATLPSQAIYSDLALGVCSGAEDFYEIQRQFDLELKKAQIDKLQVEIEKLRLEKTLLEQGKSGSSVVITNPPEQSSLSLGVTVGSTPTKVDFTKSP